jgi:hypothetical protein
MHVAQEAEGSPEVTVLEAVMAADVRAKTLQRYGTLGFRVWGFWNFGVFGFS